MGGELIPILDAQTLAPWNLVLSLPRVEPPSAGLEPDWSKFLFQILACTEGQFEILMVYVGAPKLKGQEITNEINQPAQGRMMNVNAHHAQCFLGASQRLEVSEGTGTVGGF